MTREKRVERAQIRVLFNCPFFASGVARLPVVFDESVQTATTNGKNIRWNPQWFDSLSDEEVVTVYCEEVSHCLLGHLWRMPIGGESEIWGNAADVCARNMMGDFNELKKQQGQAEPFPWPANVPQFPYGQHKDKAEEQIYQVLLKQAVPRGGNGSGKGQGGGGKPPPGQSGGQGQKPGKSPSGGQGGQPPPFAEFEHQNTNGQSQESKASRQDAQDWQNTLISSVHASKQRGECPAGMERMVNELLSSEVPWQELLRNYLRELANDDWNFMKPNIPLTDSTGFILPSLESEKMGGVAFAIDTSGSIDHELLKSFKSEEQGCLDTMKPSKITELCCDAAIHRVMEYRAGDLVDMQAPGGGGTDFVPVIEHCLQMHPQPKCLVYLTDLYGSFGKYDKEQLPFEVIWVVYGNDQNAPFGQTIRVK